MAASKQKAPWQHTFYGKRLKFVKIGPKPRLTEREKDFVRPPVIPRHMLNVPRCPICNKTVEKLAKHIARFHKGNHDRHQCPFCSVSTTRKNTLRRHMETLHPGLLAEMQQETPEVTGDARPRKQCEICLKSFLDIRRHRSKVHGPDEKGFIYECTFCPAKFRMTKSLANHTRRQHKGENICRNVEKSARNVAEKGQKQKCPECGMMVFAPDFRQHWDRHGRNATVAGQILRKFPCEICGFRFKTKQSLQRHGKVHSEKAPKTVTVGRGPRNQLGTRNWLCAVCSCRFRRKEHLQYHLKTHAKDPKTGLEPSHEGKRQCHICTSWHFPNNLPRHIRTHFNTRLFVCGLDFCNRRFSRKYDLDRHRLVCKQIRRKQRENLIGERVGGKVKCLRCNELIRSRDFARHRRWHFGEKYYRCKECPKAFVKSHDLKKHQEKHDANRPLIPCPLYSCDSKFKTKQGLAYHLLHSPDCRNGYLGQHKKLLEWKSYKKDIPSKVILVDYPDSEDDNEPRKNTFPSIEALC